MRVVVLGDVGVVDGMMHIGDEAMFLAARNELALRGAQITSISSAPTETAERYAVVSVPRIRFDGLSREAAEARLAAVWQLAEGRSTLADDDSAQAVVRAVRESDGVLIAGGGNLASTWPLHVYERSALVGIADRLGRPAVVTGQTLGPDLRDRDRQLVADLLASAALVGVREAASLRLAAELGTSARLGVDDASFVPGADDIGATEERCLLVSLSLSLGDAPREQTVRRIAALVDATAERVGGPIRFHAHFGSADDGVARGDAVLHEQVRSRMSLPSTVVPTGTVPEAASLARSAAFLITGRYHPAVFAAPAGVPVLGLVTDDYTAVKQRGALAHWGQESVVAIAHADIDGIPAAASSWQSRERVAEEAAARCPEHRARADDWWDAVAAAYRA